MIIRIILGVLASIFLWVGYNVSIANDNSAYRLAQLSNEFALAEDKCKNAAPEDRSELCNFSSARLYKDQLISTQLSQGLEFILLLISQLFILILIWLSIKKPNNKQNEIDDSVEPPVR